MKIALKILLLTLTTLTLVSCSAKKTSAQKFSFKIAAIQTGLSLNGGSFVRAINATTNTLIKLDANDSAEFEQGTWEFQTVSFEGPGAYAGRRFCGRAVGVKLSEAQKDIALTITQANCYSEPFISLMTLINASFSSTNFLTIADITPKGGPVSGGSTVTITGSGFVSGATVTVGGNPCSGLTVSSSTALNCIVPSHTTGAVTVTVTNPDSQTTSAANFYTYRVPPAISSLAPSSGAVAGGTTVTLVGTGFVAGATVMFGGAQCIAPIVNSSTSLTCTTPSFPSGTANVVITNPDGQVSNPSIFTYMPMPLVTSVAPNMGPVSGGTTITIIGTGFVSIMDVKIDSLLCTNLIVISPTQLTCMTPPHGAGSASLSITSTDGQTSTLPNAFIYNVPPIVSALNMNSGPLAGGVTITISGAGFMLGATVEIGGTPCTSATVLNSNTMTCVTSSHSPGPKTVTVTNPDSQSGNLAGNYTYRESFISSWEIASPGESITLPLVSGLNYDFMVDWGDGSPMDRITSFSSPAKTHTYTNSGTYIVTINGLVEGWSFGSSADSKLKIRTVDNFGDMGWKNLNLAFYGCSNLTFFAGGVTTAVTNMSGMFKNATGLTNLNLSSFNTSNVTNMSLMFYGVSSLTTLSLANFNTMNVTNMSYMFNEMTSITTLDLSYFNTSSVTNMNHMFYGMTSLLSLNISSFNTSNVTNMGFMFGHTNALPNLSLSSFNTANVTDMSYMFEQALVLTTLDLSNFDTTKVTDMSNMFNNAAGLTSLNVSSFNTANVTNMYQMFANMRAIPNLNLSSFNTSKVTNMASMFWGDDDLTSLNLSNFDTSLVTNMSSMFYGTTSLGILNLTGWNIGAVANSTDIFTNKNPALVVTCNQGGSPATGTLFGQSCF